jgi:phosphoglycerate dehydrogenase-like enzyme
MKRPRILLTQPLDDDAERRLQAVADIIRPAEQTALTEFVRDCDGMIARTHTPITRNLLEAGEHLKVVGIAGVGLDRVDVAAAESLGIRVVHTPAAASDAVSELTVLLMLELLRPVRKLSEAYARGAFAAARRNPHGSELRDLTVGVIGMGRIGARVGRICAAGFGARVMYNDIAQVGPFAFEAIAVEKATLYREADIVTLHVPLTSQTTGMMNTATLSQCKPGARLINTARGTVVDTDALVTALLTGQLAGAGLDTTDPEPLPGDHPLFSLENCIVTPHIAARTHGGLRRMFDVVDLVLDALRSAD